MSFVQFSQINLAFGDRDILKDVSLRLAAGSKSCLAGANGCGKTTLMKIIAGKINADSGNRAVKKNTRISYLPQFGIVHHGRKLRDEVETAYTYVYELIERLEKTGELLEKTSLNLSSQSNSTSALIEENHNLQEQIEDTGFYRREGEIASVLLGLGFSAKDMERNTGEFSGGWQMRIALAKVLLEKPDILLLDEPTNYLDIEARYWLETWLNNFKGGYLLVSHDRYFLDVCINEVYELFGGALKRYAGNYSSYEKVRKIELESLIKRFHEQQEEIIKTESLIRRFRYKASKAAFAQELVKRLEKMERIEIPESLKKISIVFPPVPHSGNIALTLEGISKSYGQRLVISSLDLYLDAKERLVVAGTNGAGKTTLLRIIAGADKDYEGSVKYGSGISMGYFSPDAASQTSEKDTDTFDRAISVLEFMEEGAPTALIPKIRDMLGAFLFRGDDVYKSIQVLSGGEKSRLALLKMLLKPINLLILDEPTNHLDLYSKDILLNVLRNFQGTIIFVSHDRAFMEELSTKTLLLTAANDSEKASAKLFYGNYAYYLEQTAKQAGSNYNEKKSNKNEPIKQTNEQINNKEQREKDKEKQAVIRKLERQEAEILKTIEELEARKESLEEELALPAVYSNREKAKEVKENLDVCISAIQSKSREWELLAGELVSLK